MISAQARLMQTALAAARFHARHQRYPESLGELTPGFLAREPINPYTARPLRYESAPPAIHCIIPDYSSIPRKTPHGIVFTFNPGLERDISQNF